ncbi:MAG: peptidoglycan DD-metalloendopeptidase family protein, partial [Prevotellaceae bacterium]|nr:peptidoglycan DD-metalloendopeptidase family protein [Prevotellaceae bacterium]
EEEEEDGDVPSSDIYENWTNEKVNPYKVSIKDLLDLQLDSLMSKYVHPLDSNGKVTSNFGPRRRRFHYGIDLKVYVGQDIYAAFDGKIRVTGFDPRGYGNYVVIRHSNGLETLYGHLSEIKVEANQDVKAGDLVGLGGSTGRSTGPHLHFEFRYLGNAINPTNIVDYETNKPLNDSYLINKNTSFREIKAYQSAKYHVVRRGDTLSGIAHRYGTTVTKICQLNGIKRTDTLRPKRRLRYS